MILDWVPAHFPDDPHGLAQFDGTPSLRTSGPARGLHQDWNSLIYNLGRTEVREFLIASALFWLEQYHVDGLRVDAVASMLYRDYSRSAGRLGAEHLWWPGESRSDQFFAGTLRNRCGERCPGALLIAEESTAWPGVTRAAAEGRARLHA